MASPAFKVASDKVQYTTDGHLIANYEYTTTRVSRTPSGLEVRPISSNYDFKTDLKVPKTGLMIVGWGGNNGTTLTAGLIANKLYGMFDSLNCDIFRNITYMTKSGLQKPDFYGSFLLASTVRLGCDETGEEVYIPFKDLMPIVNPDDIVLGGWDISGMNLADGMQRAEVLPWELQVKLQDHMKGLKPLPSIYFPDFIAANQEDRADNILKGPKQEQMEQIRKDIREFKAKNNLDKVVVLWSATTERFSDIVPGKNDTAENMLNAIKEDFSEISPSTIFAVACILEGVSYINGSPQNTLVPGVIEMAEQKCVFVGGDDFKTGQTKFKSVLTDFLIGAGIKPTSIVSYNHLGNNDGKNLSAPQQFRSKEISKSNVVDDMVKSNSILYGPGEHPDHVVVIKYVPAVADSKRALDEYTSRIFMGGTNTIVVHNTCEDSLLAAPVMLDLFLLTELSTRITYKTGVHSFSSSSVLIAIGSMTEFERFHPVLSILSYLLKAPQVPSGTPVVNALFKQRACIENILKACLGLAPEHNMGLEYKTKMDGFKLAGQTSQ